MNRLLYGLLALAVTTAASAATLTGKAIHVDDGDTIILLDSSRSQVKIRLASIDAPEASHTNHDEGRIGQPYSAQSTRFLAALVKGQEVRAECVESDRYGRRICEIFVAGTSANREMVRGGYAWANTASGGRYLRDRNLVALQKEAQAQKKGLWADPSPIAPWEWRSSCWQKGVCR